MNTLRQLLTIRRDERSLALAALLVLVALHGLVIWHYNSVFMEPTGNYWARFLHYFHLSGYDPITYSVMTTWAAKYNVYRHPLLIFFVTPLYWLNQGLMAVTGVNCVQYIVATVWIVTEVYAFLFTYRILHDIIAVDRPMSILLSVMLFGSAHVMLAAISPDHFILSMTLLLAMFYVCGRKIQQKRELTIGQTILLFVPIAGITLSNAVKVFLAALFVNGRRFFRLKYIVLAVLLPSALIWGFARMEYHYLVLPQEKIQHARKAQIKKRKQEEAQKKKAEAEKLFMQQAADAARNGDSLLLAQATVRLDSVRTAKPVVRPSKAGRPIGKGEFMRWTDITTSRSETVVENLFGEGIQLHQDHLLGDVLRNRPVIVYYRSVWNYVVEGIVVLLLIGGIIAGIASRQRQFFTLLLVCVAFDFSLHLGLGFGINEVYIMSAHWMFIIPFSIGYLYKTIAEQRMKAIEKQSSKASFWSLCYFAMFAVCTLITAFLWIWNATLTASVLVQPI